MGKNLTQQKRGKGSPTYKAPSFRYAGKARLPPYKEGQVHGVITDIIHSQGHSAPLITVKYENGATALMQAPEGVRVGQAVSICGEDTSAIVGNTMKLKDIPEGMPIFNIEKSPGDGGKFVRSSGAAAKIVTKAAGKAVIVLPSGKKKEFQSECRATIGTVAGGGRTEKPMLKAGTNYHRMRARNKLYPHVCGISMNAVDHPFGGHSSHNKGRPLQSGRNYPPGRKVGMISPRRTGRKK